MATYLTQGAETIDSICFAFYGSPPGYTEIVPGVNPNLALQPAILPSGLRITLPERARVLVRQRLSFGQSGGPRPDPWSGGMPAL